MTISVIVAACCLLTVICILALGETSRHDLAAVAPAAPATGRVADPA